jgi:hypothetical protein
MEIPDLNRSSREKEDDPPAVKGTIILMGFVG